MIQRVILIFIKYLSTNQNQIFYMKVIYNINMYNEVSSLKVDYRHTQITSRQNIPKGKIKYQIEVISKEKSQTVYIIQYT